jgi:hypothetical protein
VLVAPFVVEGDPVVEGAPVVTKAEALAGADAAALGGDGARGAEAIPIVPACGAVGPGCSEIVAEWRSSG